MDYKIFSISFIILALHSTLNLSCQMKRLENSNFNTHTPPLRFPSRLGKRSVNFPSLKTKLFDQYEAKFTQNHCKEKKTYTTNFSSYNILPKKRFHSGSQDPGISGMKNFKSKRTGFRDKNFQWFLHISRRIWNFLSKCLLNV